MVMVSKAGDGAVRVGDDGLVARFLDLGAHAGGT